jgi:hypothetical protein
VGRHRNKHLGAIPSGVQLPPVRYEAKAHTLASASWSLTSLLACSYARAKFGNPAFPSVATSMSTEELHTMEEIVGAYENQW